ncbi:hypothetical protein I4F81_001983 [Pyropia yezoensis]|uniref:Uncharacterized protein n=1 Tax=Pyropia yezoensis TaxID=2788 RepID=A0ACC3BNJ1_PYRYE|nr:hypothetical protein I4F81_001983 [Neopyropia yezoensis]
MPPSAFVVPFLFLPTSCRSCPNLALAFKPSLPASTPSPRRPCLLPPAPTPTRRPGCWRSPPCPGRRCGRGPAALRRWGGPRRRGRRPSVAAGGSPSATTGWALVAVATAAAATAAAATTVVGAMAAAAAAAAAAVVGGSICCPRRRPPCPPHRAPAVASGGSCSMAHAWVRPRPRRRPRRPRLTGALRRRSAPWRGRCYRRCRLGWTATPAGVGRGGGTWHRRCCGATRHHQGWPDGGCLPGRAGRGGCSAGGDVRVVGGGDRTGAGSHRCQSSCGGACCCGRTALVASRSFVGAPVCLCGNATLIGSRNVLASHGVEQTALGHQTALHQRVTDRVHR